MNTSSCSCENQSITNHIRPLSQMQEISVSEKHTVWLYLLYISSSFFRCSIILWYVIDRTHFALLNHCHVWRCFVGPFSPRDRFEWLCVINPRAAGHEYMLKHLKRVGDCNSSRPFKDAHCLAYSDTVRAHKVKNSSSGRSLRKRSYALYSRQLE